MDLLFDGLARGWDMHSSPSPYMGQKHNTALLLPGLWIRWSLLFDIRTLYSSADALTAAHS